jgi:hypothetical protein
MATRVRSRSPPTTVGSRAFSLAENQAHRGGIDDELGDGAGGLEGGFGQRNERQCCTREVSRRSRTSATFVGGDIGGVARVAAFPQVQHAPKPERATLSVQHVER